MVDFVKHDARDPFAFISYSKSYYNFVENYGDLKKGSIDDTQKELIEIFSQHINNSKRIEESLIMRELIHHSRTETHTVIEKINES